MGTGWTKLKEYIDDGFGDRVQLNRQQDILKWIEYHLPKIINSENFEFYWTSFTEEEIIDLAILMAPRLYLFTIYEDKLEFSIFSISKIISITQTIDPKKSELRVDFNYGDNESNFFLTGNLSDAEHEKAYLKKFIKKVIACWGES